VSFVSGNNSLLFPQNDVDHWLAPLPDFLLQPEEPTASTSNEFQQVSEGEFSYTTRVQVQYLWLI